MSAYGILFDKLRDIHQQGRERPRNDFTPGGFRAEGSPSGAVAVPSQQPASPPRAKGKETVLLVEDDEGVRIVVRRVLEKQGYQVLEAENGARALEICAEHAHAINLVLSDVVMPRMSGRVLLDRLLELPSHPKVLMMSGYTEDEIDRHGPFPPGVPFIEKPFTIAAVTTKIRDVLDGRW